jgi:hypothetical protein
MTIVADVHCDCSGIVEHDGVNTDIDALVPAKFLILDPSISSLETMIPGKTWYMIEIAEVLPRRTP